MKMTNVVSYMFGVLVCGAALFSSAQAATEKLRLTVNANILLGTCKTTILVDGNSSATVVNFNNSSAVVYTTDVKNKTVSKEFSLLFSDCAGIGMGTGEGTSGPRPMKVTFTKRGETKCENNDSGSAFANMLTTNKANAVVVEIQQNDAVSYPAKKILKCNSPEEISVNVVNDPTINTEYKLKATLRTDSGSQDSDLTAGLFKAQGVFEIEYQ